MTVRQEKYKVNRIAGMNFFNAARAAGYSEAYCKGKSYRLERVEKVGEGIRDALERAGLTDKYQAKKLRELAEATKVISCNIFVDKDGNMKKADGKSLDFIEVPDASIQLIALEHIAELKKLTSNTLIDQSQHHTIQFVTYGEIKKDVNNPSASRLIPTA